jgi:hypothetical protein
MMCMQIAYADSYLLLFRKHYDSIYNALYKIQENL